MKIGSVDINVNDPSNDWSKWTWAEFMDLYDKSLKGHVTESPETVAKFLGVKLPDKPKEKADKA